MFLPTNTDRNVAFLLSICVINIRSTTLSLYGEEYQYRRVLTEVSEVQGCTSNTLDTGQGFQKRGRSSHYNDDPAIFVEQNGMDQTTAKAWVEDLVLDS